MIEDSELLRRYVQDRSQAAFAELVQRRVNLVYSVALRTVGHDAHLAEDVTQKVFADLARKAPGLLDRPVLSGWLYRSAQFAGTDVVRSERRRRTREQETQIMNETTGAAGDHPGDWERLRPVLDAAMAELNDDDRDAVALRFFEERPFAEIGRALRLPEDTARKRVERALDKLHAILSRRGLTSTTGALGLALANQVSAAAPSGLAASVAGAAMAGPDAATAGWTVFGALTSTKAILGAVGATAVVAGVIVTREVRHATESGEVAVAASPAVTPPAARPQVAGALAPAVSVTDGVAVPASASIGRSSFDGASGAGNSTSSTFRAGISDGALRMLPEGDVQARYTHAQQLARSGALAEALVEYLWCYDQGMAGSSTFQGVRNSFLLSDLAALAQGYPPALEALRQRREQVEARFWATMGDGRTLGTEFASLNSALGDHRRNLETFDRLAPSDPRRSGVGIRIYPELIEAQRYTEAAQVRSFEIMKAAIDYASKDRPVSPALKDPERARQQNRRSAIQAASRDIEVLAGAGDVAHARAIIDQLLAFDRTEATLTMLGSHLNRAGHPELLTR